MKTHIVILACLCGALTYALPVSNSDQENIDLVQIPLNGDKELDILTLGETGQLSERNKRTIGILRQLFPELTKQVEDKVNQIVGQLIRSIGPSILRTAVGGNGRSSSRTSYDSDFTDDDDGETSDTPSGTRVQIELPSFDDDEDDDNNTASNDTADSADSAPKGSSTTEPSFVFMKKEEVANSDSEILSINLNSDLITRTDSTSTDNSETSDDATNDNAGDNTNNDSSNNDDSDSDNGDTTADTPNTDAGTDGSSDSAADAPESTTISDESNII